MDTLTGVYIGCLGVGLVYAIFSMVFSGHSDAGGHDIGGGHDVPIGGHDVGHDIGGHDAGQSDVTQVSPLSPTVIACFVAAFGAFGWTGRGIGFGALGSALFGVVGGLAIGTGVFYLLAKVFYACEASSEGKQIDMIGRVAEVITPIPPGHPGEIAYILGGSRYTAPAMTDEPSKKEVPKGSSVRIKRVVGATVYVDPE
jgi:membrane protein implicated in regulation of membrane protease activity